MIKQIISDKLIQTELAVDVDGVRVNYLNKGNLQYEFFTNCVDAETAWAAIQKVIDEMAVQSYDHHASWRVDTMMVDDSLLERYGQYSVNVKFYVHDTY